MARTWRWDVGDVVREDQAAGGRAALTVPGTACCRWRRGAIGRSRPRKRPAPVPCVRPGVRNHIYPCVSLQGAGLVSAPRCLFTAHGNNSMNNSTPKTPDRRTGSYGCGSQVHGYYTLLYYGCFSALRLHVSHLASPLLLFTVSPFTCCVYS